MRIVQSHKEKVKERGYKYLGTYNNGEYTYDKHILITTRVPYIRVKCPYCEEEYDVRVSNFKNGSKCTNCCNEYENSFAYHIQVELGEPLNKYWDWEKNIVNPYCISKNRNAKNSKGKSLKIWIKCDKTNYHESYEISCNNFTRGKRCPCCVNQKIHPKDSIIQWCLDNVDIDFEIKYLSDKNTLNLWEVAPRSRNKIWLKCQETDYHDDYQMECCQFVYKKDKNKCPQCINHKGNVHSKDSFGTLYPQKAKYWDLTKNITSPYEIASHTHDEYWFICEKCGESFKKNIDVLNRTDVGVVCKKCNASEGEQLIKNYLDNMNIINGIDCIHDKEYFKDLIGLGGGILRPDFILPDLKIWIEYDGAQHEEFVPWMHGTYEEFEKQQRHDELKNKYAIKHGWNLIRIKSEDKDNIETILENIFKEVI